MLKIGVLGAGFLGKIHLKLIREIKGYELIGFFDPNDGNAALAEKEFGVRRFADADALMDAVDVVDIVTPTLTHFELASRAIKRSKHIFIEKPIAQTLEEARQLVALAEEAHVKGMVGHVERFNPAFLAVKDRKLNPMFIEVHRLAQFNPRGTDVPVVLDLMIHDIDIILTMVKSSVKKIVASGVSVISDSPDIANARIEFDNGCVANLTSSRISLKQMRKMRVFQRDAYISIDFLEKKSEIIELHEQNDVHNPYSMEIQVGPGKTKFMHISRPQTEPVNSIKLELELFLEAIINDTEPPVSLHAGTEALNVALQVMEKISKFGLG